MQADIDRPVTEIPPEILPELKERYRELSKTLHIIDESELPDDYTLVYVPSDIVQDLTFRRRRKR